MKPPAINYGTYAADALAKVRPGVTRELDNLADVLRDTGSFQVPSDNLRSASLGRAAHIIESTLPLTSAMQHVKKVRPELESALRAIDAEIRDLHVGRIPSTPDASLFHFTETIDAYAAALRAGLEDAAAAPVTVSDATTRSAATSVADSITANLNEIR